MMPMPQAAIAIPRCRNGKISHMIACESGMSGPPPMPWINRATSSTVRFGASPQSTDENVNTVVQMRKKRLRPSTPASHPVAGRTTALAARYEVSTHDTSSTAAESDPWMCGSATFVTVVSSTCMIVTSITAPVIIHLCAGVMPPSASSDVSESVAVRRMEPATVERSATRDLRDPGQAAEEVAADATTDSARSPGHQNLHGKPPLGEI